MIIENKTYIPTIIVLIVLSITTLFSCEPLVDNCSGDPRDNYVGTCECEETSQSFGQSAYLVTISKVGGDSAKISINNFYQLGTAHSVEASIDCELLTFSSGEIDNNIVNGSGTLAGESITMSYTVFDGADTDNVTAVYTKQVFWVERND